VGSHFCEALLARGDEVICIDNFLTGSRTNVENLEHQSGFTLICADLTDGPLPALPGSPSAVVHLASPASPIDYLSHPLETLSAGSEGTRQALELASQTGARFLLASTSEVYGDPLRHPQSESYWGNVNPIGPRSVYDEAKRFAEALTMAWHRARGVNVGIARIFNTYGPRMRPDDGRVVSNFLAQALEGSPLTIYGDGSQTRSPCYVDDMVRGLIALLDSGCTGPVNLGNPDEISILELAHKVLDLTGSTSLIEYRDLPTDDPTRRRPDITLAREKLGWEPTVDLDEGLSRSLVALRAERTRRPQTWQPKEESHP
jgi:dTDP-glucose 4,6-dehydratase